MDVNCAVKMRNYITIALLIYTVPQYSSPRSKYFEDGQKIVSF